MLTIEELMEKMLTEYESEDIIFTLTRSGNASTSGWQPL